MGRVHFGSLTSTGVIAAAFVATSLVTAHAADLRPMVTKAPPPAPIFYNWTGFYLGVNLGGSWGHDTDEIFDEGVGVFNASNHVDGVIGGGQIGYNWQFAPWFGWGNGTVLGIEADIQGSGQKRTTDFAFTDTALLNPDVTGSVEDKLQWFGTVRGRIGIAFDRVLPYFTGGWAYGERRLEANLAAFAPGSAVPSATASFSESHTNTNGWTVGGGIEWAFWGNWTAKFEYLYIDWGNQNNNNNDVFTVEGNTFTTNRGHFTDNIARAGVNYRF